MTASEVSWLPRWRSRICYLLESLRDPVERTEVSGRPGSTKKSGGKGLQCAQVLIVKMEGYSIVVKQSASPQCGVASLFEPNCGDRNRHWSEGETAQLEFVKMPGEGWCDFMSASEGLSHLRVWNDRFHTCRLRGLRQSWSTKTIAADSDASSQESSCFWSLRSQVLVIRARDRQLHLL